MTTKHWRFAWKFSFRATGWLLAFIAGALLVARLAIALANMELAESTFASFEVVIPLIVGLHAALLFAPDDEPALELLLAVPRPPVYLIYERLAALIALQGGLALVLSALAVITSPGANLFDVIVVWLPPAVCIIGLCMTATLYARRTAFGVLTAIAICVAMAFGREVILPMFPNLWFMIFYLDPSKVTTDQYFLNRLFLLAVGAAALGLVLYRMRDEEKLLGFQEVKNG
ncbi:MAG: hypothetical protein IT319_02495 [Anaerolineae bacterium]|nr:hypothetical protein [Anaerolineae bacterium]